MNNAERQRATLSHWESEGKKYEGEYSDAVHELDTLIKDLQENYGKISFEDYSANISRLAILSARVDMLQRLIRATEDGAIELPSTTGSSEVVIRMQGLAQLYSTYSNPKLSEQYLREKLNKKEE
jgi:hypothetical protein